MSSETFIVALKALTLIASPFVFGILIYLGCKIADISKTEKHNPVSPAPVPTQPHRQTPLLERLRRLLKARFPVLYAQVLEPTLADLREEHSAALAEGHPFKARRVLLQGYGALAAAAICQLGFSLLGRIVALWQARSSK